MECRICSLLESTKVDPRVLGEHSNMILPKHPFVVRIAYHKLNRMESDTLPRSSEMPSSNGWPTEWPSERSDGRRKRTITQSAIAQIFLLLEFCIFSAFGLMFLILLYQPKASKAVIQSFPLIPSASFIRCNYRLWRAWLALEKNI